MSQKFSLEDIQVIGEYDKPENIISKLEGLETSEAKNGLKLFFPRSPA